MGGVNVTLQAAAALDRRGITAWVENSEVVVLIDYSRDKIRIKYRKFSAKRYQSRGTEWEWIDSYDEPHYHPLDDYEGLAAAFEKYLREEPEFAGTLVRHRMDRMGWTWEEESREALEKAHETIAKNPELVEQHRRMGMWPPKCGHDHPVSQPAGQATRPARR